MSDPITIFPEPMTIKQIAAEFNKSTNSVSMGIKRMLERNPDHQDWRFKKGKTTYIKPDGIYWLSQYFNSNHAISHEYDREKIRMAQEIQTLKAELKDLKDRQNLMIVDALNKQQETFMIEMKEKNNQVDTLIKEKDSVINDLISTKNDFEEYKEKSNDRIVILENTLDIEKNRKIPFKEYLKRRKNK